MPTVTEESVLNSLRCIADPDGRGDIVDVFTYLWMAGLACGVVVGTHGEEGCAWVNGAEEEDLVDGDGEEAGEGGGEGGEAGGRLFFACHCS